METIEVFVPLADTRSLNYSLAPRLKDLNGSRIGWFNNRKANAAALLQSASEAWAAEGIQCEAVVASKDATLAASEEVMSHLKTCDAVVLAISD